MMHAFTARILLSGSSEASADYGARVTQMREKGWEVTQPVVGVDAAVAGAAGCYQSKGWLVLGLAFLTDRAAVQTQLGISEAEAAAQSDLELLAHLRALKGDGFAKDISGSFSIVLINLNTGNFEAYRDHFGVYPFFYTVTERAVTCGSDLRACLHLSGVKLTVDPLRIADFIHGEEIDRDRTAFASVLRLPPAHRLITDQDGVATQGYWELTYPETYSGQDGPADLRHALGQATAVCVGSDHPVGAMLSGGLDSSSLAGLAAQSTPKPLPTLSFVYGSDKAYDETPFIDAANDAFNTVAHKIPVSEGVPLDALGPVIEEQFDLFLAPGLPKSRQIYAEAKSLGVGLLIDGHGGDEAISHGYGRLVELAAGRQYLSLFREAKGAALVHGVPVGALVLGHIARYGGLRPGHPVRRVLMKLSRMLSRRTIVADWSGKSVDLIAADLRSSFDASARYRPEVILKSKADFKRASQITHLHSLTDPLVSHALEVLHRSATAAGVLPRYPFFDRRVISLCLAFPGDLKLRDGRSRWALREAMAGILPDKIRLRVDKAEFGVEVRQTIVAFFRDKDAGVFEGLSAFVDVHAAEELRAKVISGSTSEVAAVRALWRLAVLIHWVKAFDAWRDAQTKGVLI